MKTGMKWALGALLSAVVLVPSGAFAVPQQMNVQGYLTDATGGAVDGTFTVQFALYPAKSGGTAAWKETLSSVVVSTGLFDELLGADLLNPLTPAVFTDNVQLWLGIQILAGPGVPNGGEAELPRNAVATVAYAFEASHAIAATTANMSKDLQCSGACVSAAEVGFNYAASSSQGGDALNALKLNGKDYATLVTDVAAEASKSIKIDQSGMPANGLNEVSNGLITNQFIDKVTHSYDNTVPAYTPPDTYNPLAIKDQNPTGTTDTIDFPDIGTAEKLTVSVNLTNSDLKSVKVTLTDPSFTEYVLYDKGGTSDNQNLSASYPDPTTPVSGNLTTWVGKNPKGKWVLKVVDSGFLNNKNDGQINAWSVGIQTLSNKKVEVAGDLIVDGKLTGISGIAMQGDTTITGKLTVSGLTTLSGGLALGGGGTITGLTSFADETTFEKLATFKNGIDLKGIKPAVNMPDPTASLDAANRHYVDVYSERSPNGKQAWIDNDASYTVPTGKTLVITALSSYYTSYYMYIYNPANGSYHYYYPSGGNGAWQHDWTRIYVPAGYTIYQASPTNVAISGYLTSDPEGTPINDNVVTCGAAYTVPTGKTLVITSTSGYYSSYYPYVYFPSTGLYNYWYQRYNQGYTQQERTEIYVPAGAMVYANGCTSIHYQYSGWSGYLIPALP